MLLSVLVEVKGLADCRRVVMLGRLRVHAVLWASRADPEMVWRQDEGIVRSRARRRGLNLQVRVMTLRVVACRLLLGIRLGEHSLSRSTCSRPNVSVLLLELCSCRTC